MLEVLIPVEARPSSLGPSQAYYAGAVASLPEELLLLALDDEKGSVVFAASTALEFGLAGAELAELSLAGRVAVEDGKLRVLETGATGDDALDAAVARIAGSRRARSAQHWVSSSPAGQKRYLARLTEHGAVRRERRELLGVLPVTRHPATGAVEPELRTRLRAVVLEGAEPDERTRVLLALVRACSLEKELFERGERRAAKARIAELTRDDALAGAVGKAVAASTAAVAAAVVAATSAGGAAAAGS